jgi:cytochrome c oxidase cbb3-type subunit 3
MNKRLNKRLRILEHGFENANLRSRLFLFIPHPSSFILTFIAVAIAAGLTSCERERREFRESPPSAAPLSAVKQSQLQPGSQATDVETKTRYEENAYDMSEGKRLYEWFNCVGCHAQGGGQIGPPLMDDKWIYGGNPENIFASIIEGRPNGMPSYGGKVPANEVWQIVAYVRSMSGQAPKDAAPSRSDHMQTKQPEQSKEKEQPKPQPAERRQ